MRVVLPIFTPNSKPDRAAAPGVSSVPVVARGERILIIDDDRPIREILEETLREAGFGVETAGCAEEAMEKLRKAVFCLILLDIRMPGHSGLDLLRHLRSGENAAPIMVITGLASTEEMDEARRLGAVKCVRKPFRIRDVLADICEILGLGAGNSEQGAVR